MWTIGTLAPLASQVLGVTFEGREAGRHTLVGEVATADPLDPRLGDNRATAAITVAEHGGSVPGAFYTVVPCRVVDTRNPGGLWGGPALAAQSERVFPIAGLCGVSPAAKAVALNLTVTGATASGHLRAYPAFPPSLPRTSVLNFVAGVTRANNAVVSLSTLGEIAVFNSMATGTAHLVVDVVGYFE